MRRRWWALVALVLAAAGAVVVWQVGGDGAREPIRTGSPEARGARVLRYDVRSRFVGRELAQVAIAPDGAISRPLLVLLPGRGEDGSEVNAVPELFAALAALGDRAPAVLLPDGGDSSYFHARGSGDWERYVFDEAIPEAEHRLGADSRKVAIGGFSMGGYGAFHLARLRPGRFCAVGAHSPALWLEPGETADGAFDDADDWQVHGDLVGLARGLGREPWGGARLWLDVGDDDPFLPAARAFAQALGVPLRVEPGPHGEDFWHPRLGRYLRFYADALAGC